MTAQATVADARSIELAPIMELSDRVGVLTIYVDADPALARGRRPAWQAPVRAGLRKLVKDARWTRPHDEWLALEARLAELKPELEALLDPRGRSRGRALIAAIDGPQFEYVELQAPVSTLVELSSSARVLPLLAGLQHGRPAGVATVSWGGLETAEWELGALRRLDTIELTEQEPHDRRPATNPAVPQPFPERDRFAGAVGARVLAQVQDAGATLALRAADRSWDVLVADGDPRLLEALAGGLGSETCELVASTRPIGQLSAAGAAGRVAAVVAEVRGEQSAALVRQFESAAMATSDPLVLERSLDEGRVETLLLEEPRHCPGPRHVETWLRRAFATGAEVMIVPAGSAALGSSGAAALLRW